MEGTENQLQVKDSFSFSLSYSILPVQCTFPTCLLAGPALTTRVRTYSSLYIVCLRVKH